MSAFPRKFLQPIAIAVALAFVYFAVIVKLANDWWHDENYSHGLLIPFVIAFILWQERKHLGEMKRDPWTWIGGGGIALSLFMLWAGTAGAELFVQRVSLVLMLVSVVIYFFGARIIHLLAIPLFLFVLAIPIPQIIFNRIAFPLQLFASRCAVSAMWFFNIPVLRQGNVIELMPRGATEPKRLAVVEACSGIRSLMTLVTLAVIYAYFTKPKSRSGPGDGGKGTESQVRTSLSSVTFWRSLILIVSAVPIAILTNALRVSGTGVLAHYYGTRVADGFFHEFSGWVIYIAAALLLFATAWIFDRIVPFLKKLFRGGLPAAWSGGSATLNELELSK
jgi:exosortase